jgi:hypothetical protein
MKNIIMSFLSLSILLGCANSSMTKNENELYNLQVITSDSTENVALKYLFEKLSKLPNVSFKDNQILIGDTSIYLKINVEFDSQNEDKWIYAANISTFFKTDKETQINVGSIGIGSNRNEAIDVCIQEWFAVFGIPFTNMLIDDNSISEANMKIFSGLMGIRGNLPENTWLKGDNEMIKRIFSKIKEQIKKETSNIIPIDIKLIIGKNGVSEGECRINNNVSEQLLEILKQLNWPISNEVFIFKQFYLVKKKADQ